MRHRRPALSLVTRSSVSFVRRWPRLGALLVPSALLASCANVPDADPGANPQSLISTGTPYRGPSITGAIPALPGLVVGARPVSAPYNRTGPNDIHDAVFLASPDLAAAPTTVGDAWLAAAAGDAYSASPALRPQLTAALASARSHADGDWRRLDEHFVRLADALDGTLGVNVTWEPWTEFSAGYRTERARWLKSLTVTQPSCIGTNCTAKYQYADPNHFNELRRRGARTYCAAREAYRQQPAATTVMGRREVAGFDIGDRHIGFLVLEPTVVLEKPEQLRTTANDGAEAFAIPMQVGSRLRLLSFLPSLPEVRVPVSYVMGDSEVVNTSDAGSRTWQTVTHADAMLSGRRSLDIHKNGIPLFTIGPVSVTLNLGLRTTIGDTRDVTVFGRLLQTTASPGRLGGWTGPYVDGRPRYHDGFWRLSSYVPSSGPIRATTDGGTLDGALSLDPYDPFATRALQNDDHAVRVATSLEVTAGLGASAALRTDVMEVGVEVEGNITGRVQQIHTIREQAEMASRLLPLNEFTTATPEAGLVVTPGSSTDLRVSSFNARLILRLNLPLVGWIDLGGQLFDIRDRRIAEASAQAWPETTRLRIGTGSRVGADTMRRPTVTSHWPGGADFASLPESIDTCLAGPAPVRAEPPLCAPSPAPDGAYVPPRLNVCAYYPAGWIGEFAPGQTPAQHACIAALQGWLRDASGVRWQGPWEGDYSYNGTVARATETVDSRVLDVQNAAARDAYMAVARQCATAFGSRVQEVLYVGACDARARPTRVLDVTAPSASPADAAAGVGTCS